jgi:DNA processing protein
LFGILVDRHRKQHVQFGILRATSIRDATAGGRDSSPRNTRTRRFDADVVRVSATAPTGSVTPHIAPQTNHEELAALVALLRAQPIPADRIATIAEEIGSAVELVRQLRTGEWISPDGQRDIGLLDDQMLERADVDVREWMVRGYDVRTVFDDAYPANLREVFNRPPFIFVHGEWCEDPDSVGIAVVGTRQASPEGLRRAAQLAEGLAKNGVTVVSGLAAGIDAAAHTAALRAGGRTTAVLGTGINKMYPAENAPIARAIAGGAGALMSQFLPDQPPQKWTFPKRNVVMSGLSLATVVIEASWTSGARVQATEALRHGRTVYLLRSLVESHDWARKYVDEGYHGVRAIELASIEQLLDNLSVAVPSLAR